MFPRPVLVGYYPACAAGSPSHILMPLYSPEPTKINQGGMQELILIMLRSAVGKTHVLRSGLVMDYTNQLPIKIGTFQFLSTGLHGLCFGYCFSGPLPLRSLTNGPLFRVRFGESLVVRLYSEIDHLHLSIEAQCVIALLPLGDCHTMYMRG